MQISFNFVRLIRMTMTTQSPFILPLFNGDGLHEHPRDLNKLIKKKWVFFSLWWASQFPDSCQQLYSNYLFDHFSILNIKLAPLHSHTFTAVTISSSLIITTTITEQLIWNSYYPLLSRTIRISWPLHTLPLRMYACWMFSFSLHSSHSTLVFVCVYVFRFRLIYW